MVGHCLIPLDKSRGYYLLSLRDKPQNVPEGRKIVARRFNRGRTASYPTAPSQIPASGITAPGSSGLLASAAVFAIPRSEVFMSYPAFRIRPMFPLRAAQPCHSLPHVVGPTASEYYGVI